MNYLIATEEQPSYEQQSIDQLQRDALSRQLFWLAAIVIGLALLWVVIRSAVKSANKSGPRR